MVTYQWRVYPFHAAGAGDASSPRRKFYYEPTLNDNVQVRPKCSKEQGFTGSITAINYASSANEKTEENVIQSSKKRKIYSDDVRVTIQQHCYIHHKAKHVDCISCQFMRHNVRTSRLVPVYDLHLMNSNKMDGDLKTSLVLLTPDTTTFRQLARSHLRPNDNVLEIGCSTGECTALLLRRILLFHHEKSIQAEKQNNASTTEIQGSIVAFDTGTKILQQADNRLRKEYRQLASTLANDDGVYSKLIQLYKVDALADPKRACSLVTKHNTCLGMVLIDIGGNRQLDSVVCMIDWVQSTFTARVIIVKSEALEIKLSKEILSSCATDNNDCTLPSVDDDGIISNGQSWFNSLVSSPAFDKDKGNLSRQQLLSKYVHPKKAPLVLSPNGSIPICRYHNYHLDGCKKFNKSKSATAGAEDGNLQCKYDHDHCHLCRKAGHFALSCPMLK